MHSFYQVLLNGLLTKFSKFNGFKKHLFRKCGNVIGKHSVVSKGTTIHGDFKSHPIVIGDYSSTGRGSTICYGTQIGDHLMIGKNCTIFTENHKRKGPNDFSAIEFKEVIIGNNCWIGQNVIILPGAVIGDNCTIGAGAVVPGKKFESNSLIAGNPAKVVKHYE